jgi:hypothetical protein
MMVHTFEQVSALGRLKEGPQGPFNIFVICLSNFRKDVRCDVIECGIFVFGMAVDLHQFLHQ